VALRPPSYNTLKVNQIIMQTVHGIDRRTYFSRKLQGMLGPMMGAPIDGGEPIDKSLVELNESKAQKTAKKVGELKL
jgi:hypothetical protein